MSWTSQNGISISGIFSIQVRVFGEMEADLYEIQENHQLSRSYIKKRCWDAEDLDALNWSWPQSLLYAFSRIKVLERVLLKIRQDGVEVLLIAPHWPRCPWFPELRKYPSLILSGFRSGQISSSRVLSCTCDQRCCNWLPELLSLQRLGYSDGVFKMSDRRASANCVTMF